MDKIVTLSKVRKDKARAARRAAGDANAAKFGRTKAQKAEDAAEAARRAAALEGHRRTDRPGAEAPEA